MLRAWRIVKASRASSAFDGEGARLYGGRWNSPGTAVIYAAQSESLAALELLVHLQASHLLMAYCSIPVDFSEALVEAVDPETLSPRWRDYPAPSILQQFGDRWAAEQRTAILQAPSAVIPGEPISIINPRHGDFGRLVIGSPKPFTFDPRLK
jgi:RES domain-containing protein